MPCPDALSGFLIIRILPFSPRLYQRVSSVAPPPLFLLLYPPPRNANHYTQVDHACCCVRRFSSSSLPVQRRMGARRVAQPLCPDQGVVAVYIFVVSVLFIAFTSTVRVSRLIRRSSAVSPAVTVVSRLLPLPPHPSPSASLTLVPDASPSTDIARRVLVPFAR